uniref:Uncharacterized protein n=1 Tax=Oryza meridionalis TaxID=40149 RepID=A0A0E0CGY1_9ORYZ
MTPSASRPYASCCIGLSGRDANAASWVLMISRAASGEEATTAWTSPRRSSMSAPWRRARAPRQGAQGAVREVAGEVVQVADHRQRPRPRRQPQPPRPPRGRHREVDERYDEERQEQQVLSELGGHG